MHRTYEYNSYSKISWEKWYDKRKKLFPQLYPQNVYVGIEVLVKSSLNDILIEDETYFFYYIQIKNGVLIEKMNFNHQQHMQWKTHIQDDQIEMFMQEMISLFDTIAYGFLPVEGQKVGTLKPFILNILKSEGMNASCRDNSINQIDIRIENGGFIYMYIYNNGNYSVNHHGDDNGDLALHQVQKIKEALHKNRLQFLFS